MLLCGVIVGDFPYCESVVDFDKLVSTCPTVRVTEKKLGSCAFAGYYQWKHLARPCAAHHIFVALFGVGGYGIVDHGECSIVANAWQF